MVHKAKFVTEVIVIDPDFKAPVNISVFKHENGGMFAIDSSFIEQTFDADENVHVLDMFSLDVSGENGVYLVELKDN